MKNRLLYIKMKELGVDNFYIELHHVFPCNTRDELLSEEGKTIREIGTLNQRIEQRDKKQYYQDNHERIKQCKKERYKDNCEEIKQKSREYYHNNKQSVAEWSKKYYSRNRGIILQKKREFYQRKKKKEEEGEVQSHHMLNTEQN